MRQRGISYDDCRSRYKVGCSTITLIMNRFKESGKDLDTLKQMPAEEVEHLFFPPENLRRKDDSVMPDYHAEDCVILRQIPRLLHLKINIFQL